ncbi:DUF3942 family protein [Bacillus mycoides]|uniref:DUF3942 family protein n=1 Tax=Bacillus mycoides TaxID=1405 RepID=UPI0035575E60
MSNLNQTINKLKVYLGEDQEEKILREKFNELNPIFRKIDEQFPKPSKKNHLVIAHNDNKYVYIENTKLELIIDKERNVIVVYKHENIQSTKLDEIVLQDNELYCTGRGEKFTEDILSAYLNEVFEEFIG